MMLLLFAEGFVLVASSKAQTMPKALNLRAVSLRNAIATTCESVARWVVTGVPKGNVPKGRHLPE
jgi:hypothetical protein